MKIRTKLIIAFMVIILAPVILSTLCGVLLSQYQFKLMEESYEIELPGYESLSDTTQLLNKVTQKVYMDITEEAKRNPGRFHDIHYLEDLNARLERKFSFLIVREGENIVFNGSKDIVLESIENLPEYDFPEEESSNVVYMGGNNKYLIKQVDFLFSDGAQGSAFILTVLGQVIPEIERLVREIIIATLIILSCTGILLIGWIYQSIVKPLKQVQEATRNIKEGNLEFTLDTRAADEIGELCRDFEEMRKRLKESAEEKLQYDKESKELISNISHDLKTPITAIKGYIEGILDGVADSPEKQEKYFRTIYNKANDMSRLIDELTFYSKIDTNRIPYTFKKININQYFRDCVDELSIELEEKNIELTYFNYADENIVIIADAEQLRKVVNNIIGNSVKYIGRKKGIINIRVKDAGDFVQVEIEDNGKGIAPRDLPYIFDRFYRTDSSRNSSQGGSGIGLSIVKKIIEDHGGRIWATSKEDTGTVMCFVFRKYQEDMKNE